MTLPERWILANGMTVLYRRDVLVPLAFATLLFRSGSRQEARPQAGLASMTVDLLMQGTRRRTARELARAMESVGASLGAQVHEDYAEIGFVAPAAEIDRALNVATEVLREPSFPAEEIVKEKAHVLAALASRRDAIFNLAYDPLNEILFGDHPYSRPLEGREETVRTFRRRALLDWHRGRLRPEQGILSLVAPFPKSEMIQRLHQTIERWRPDSRHMGPPLWTTGVRQLKASQSRKVGSSFEQAYLMAGWQAPAAAHPDHVLLKVINTLLGGGMSSRLFVTLREKLGLAYEVSSFYPTRLDLSQWVIYLGLPKDKLAKASQKLNELLDRLASAGPAPDELRQAQAMIRGAFVMDRQSRRRQAWYDAWWEFLGRGAKYGDEFLKAVDAVTVKQAHRFLQSILQQPRVTVTVVPK